MQNGYSWSAKVVSVPVYEWHIQDRCIEVGLNPYTNRHNALTALSIIQDFTQEELQHCFGRTIDPKHLSVISRQAIGVDGQPRVEFRLQNN